MFVLADDEADVVNGLKATEPLIIRANLGDCIEVTLTNKLPEALPPTEHPDVPVSAPWPPSNRVSLHVHNLKYDVRGSDGATVGFNPDQTIGPGESITYRWFADEEGTYLLQSFGDVRNHRHRGLFGVLVVEPYGATYHHSMTGKRLHSGAQAEIRLPGREDFREFVVVAQNGISICNTYNIRLLGNAGGLRCIPGDYLYRSGIIRWDLESGMWGIFRVHDRTLS